MGVGRDAHHRRPARRGPSASHQLGLHRHSARRLARLAGGRGAPLYLFVSLATTNGQPSTMNPFGELCFGMLVGVNAGANFMLVFAALFFIFWIAAMPVAPFLAAGLSLINALAAVPALAGAPWFAAVLGWASWAMPMSWPATALGLLFFVINAAAIAFGVPFNPHFEWWTGTVILHGGVLYTGRNGYNLGNFSFFHPDFSRTQPWFSADTTPPLLNAGTVQGLTFHETGQHAQRRGLRQRLPLFWRVDRLLAADRRLCVDRTVRRGAPPLPGRPLGGMCADIPKRSPAAPPTSSRIRRTPPSCRRS